MLIICYLLIFTVCFTSYLIDTLNLIGLFDAHIIYYPCLCLRFNIILAQGADSEILIQLQFICMYEAHLCHWHRQHWNAGCIQMSMYYYIQIFFSQTGLIVPICFVLRKAETVMLLNGCITSSVCLFAIYVHYFNCACPLNITHKICSHPN